MKTFSVRDLREHTGALIQGAEEGKLSLITKRGHPVFLAVPFDDHLLETGLTSHLAIQLHQTGGISTENAARFSNLSVEQFLKKLSALGISVLPEQNKQQLKQELSDFNG